MMGWGNMMGGWGYGPGAYSMGWFGILGMVMELVFWVVLIVIVYKLFRSQAIKSSKDQKVNRSENKALEILRVRYANGEINVEEYNQRKTELER